MSEFLKAEMQVTLVDSMGSDLSVVNAARVSFDKESYWITLDEPSFEGMKVLDTRDERLINYLASHNHWTPFGHCFATFRIKAPLFLARQLGKHQVGLVWNEVSRRYVDSEPEFFVPETLRGRVDNVKQGSSLNAVESLREGTDYPRRDFLIQASLDLYRGLLEDGVAPEEARMYLPQNMMTEWIWSGSLAAFSRVCKLRLDSHTQLETQQLAQGIDKEMSQLFPVSWKALQS
jgi:thymidylate synthase (FAD)